jgi:N-acylneuraminate cytidylyltransferase
MRKISVVALIPARAGSRRVPNKNIRLLGSHPLLAYTINAAVECGTFDAVIVSTDSERIAAVARHYGAEVPFLRPPELATDSSPDIEWMTQTLSQLRDESREFKAFALLRPTSPLRAADTIRRAWSLFSEDSTADSLRAVEPCEQHPGKMWRIVGNRLVPVLPVQPDGTPWHSTPTQSLPKVWVQNASLEFGRTRNVFEDHSIAGKAIVPFPTKEYEGYDINTERDWTYLELLIERGEITLPTISVAAPYLAEGSG